MSIMDPGTPATPTSATFGATDYTTEQFEARVLLYRYAERLMETLKLWEKAPAPKGASIYAKDVQDTITRMNELKDVL